MGKEFSPRIFLRYWALRLWRNGTWIVLPITIFLVIMPSWYVWKAKLPPLENLQRREGFLTYKKLDNKRGALVGVVNERGAEYFTCRAGELETRHDCVAFNILKSLEGKVAEVLWFEQKIYFGSSQNRLARLVVDGEEKISLEKTAGTIEFDRKLSVLFLVGYTFFMVLVVRAFDKQRKSKEADEQNNN